jgi:hypothetical protein
VLLLLDRAWPFAAVCGLSRDDVAGDDPGLLPGFRATVETAGLPPGGHELRAYARDAEGRWYEVGYRPFWICATPLPELPRLPPGARIEVEQIAALSAEGAVTGRDAAVPLDGFAIVVGTAAGPDGTPAAGVVAADDAGGRWTAPCDVDRPDLAATRGSAASRIGFEIAVPAAALGRGRHRLRLSAFAAGGRLSPEEIETTVDVGVQAGRFPAYLLPRPGDAHAAAALSRLDEGAQTSLAPDEPVSRGAIVIAEGWSLDGLGRPGECVFVELDSGVPGVPPHRFPALAGFRRDAPPARVPAPPLADGWFTARLDTAQLGPRTYAVGVAVVDRERRGYVRRALGRLTIAPAERGR